MSAFTLPSYRSSDRHRLVALLLVVALLAASSTLASSAASQQVSPPAASNTHCYSYADWDTNENGNSGNLADLIVPLSAMIRCLK